MINMQITNPVVCDTSKGSLYNQIKPPLAVEHAFPMTGFAIRRTLQMVAAVGKCQLADRSCLTHVIPKPSLETRLLGGGSYVTVRSHGFTLLQRRRC